MVTESNSKQKSGHSRLILVGEVYLAWSWLTQDMNDNLKTPSDASELLLSELLTLKLLRNQAPSRSLNT